MHAPMWLPTCTSLEAASRDARSCSRADEVWARASRKREASACACGGGMQCRASSGTVAEGGAIMTTRLPMA